MFLLLIPSPPRAAAVDFDCDDFSNQATAQEYLHPGDPYFLDADGDGIACEGLPCPCAGKPQGSGQTTPKSTPPYRLSMQDARRTSRKAAREFAQSDGRVTAVFVGECQRRAERHVNCLAVDRGESKTNKTVCHLRVVVLAGSRYPRAKVASSRCRTTSRLKLTEAQALAAIGEEMSKLAGAPVRIPGIQRISRISFAASVEWTRSNALNAPENCSGLAEAKTWSQDHIGVSLLVFDCTPPRTM
jgi:Excalibur calcium-binding domain